MAFRKILIMGLPGAGKTTLAKELAKRLNAVHFNADEVRATINAHLGFSMQDRVAQALHMGWMCDLVVKSGHRAIADFICPNELTRAAFQLGGRAAIVWCARVDKCQYEDTNRLFLAPKNYLVKVTAEGRPIDWAYEVHKALDGDAP